MRDIFVPVILLRQVTASASQTKLSTSSFLNRRSLQEEEEISYGSDCSGDCIEPGHFCGIDGECHPFSCANFYQYADPLLTGYADDTTLNCFGYLKGEANGVIYSCQPIFPSTLVAPEQHVAEPFNRKCIAEREGGYLFECYDFQQSETSTDFSFLIAEANSVFLDCGEGQSASYYSIVASTNRYTGFEGLQGNPIVASGSDLDGATIWQTNEMNTFDRELALKSMYANVVIPRTNVFDTIDECQFGGNNPLKDPADGPQGDAADGDTVIDLNTPSSSPTISPGPTVSQAPTPTSERIPSSTTPLTSSNSPSSAPTSRLTSTPSISPGPTISPALTVSQRPTSTSEFVPPPPTTSPSPSSLPTSMPTSTPSISP